MNSTMIAEAKSNSPTAVSPCKDDQKSSKEVSYDSCSKAAADILDHDEGPRAILSLSGVILDCTSSFAILCKQPRSALLKNRRITDLAFFDTPDGLMEAAFELDKLANEHSGVNRWRALLNVNSYQKLEDGASLAVSIDESDLDDWSIIVTRSNQLWHNQRVLEAILSRPLTTTMSSRTQSKSSPNTAMTTPTSSNVSIGPASSRNSLPLNRVSPQSGIAGASNSSVGTSDASSFEAMYGCGIADDKAPFSPSHDGTAHHHSFHNRALSSSSLTIASEPKHLRILIVDDSPTSLKLMRRMMERLGHVVSTATNGKEALDLLEHEAFDIVLMDINMPMMNGLQASHEFRQIERAHRAAGRPYQRIIAMSGDISNSLFHEVTNAGFDAFIPKPLTEERFHEVLQMPFSQHS